MAASEPIDRHYANIVNQLTLISTHLEELLEDPLFIDHIHGEQEMNLDFALEQLEVVRTLFEPAPPKPEFRPQFDADSVDSD